MSTLHKCPWLGDSFVDCKSPEELLKFKSHAAHVMIWSPASDTDVVIGIHKLKARVLMQLRFDGKIGFPGGLVDEMENFDSSRSVEDALSMIKNGVIRELQEESGLDVAKHGYNLKYLYSSFPAVNPEGWCLHFYICKVSLEVMETLEQSASNFVDEVLGVTKVPLYTLENQVGGFPTFLNNCFAGNALEQLIKALLEEKLLSEVEVRSAYQAATKIYKNNASNASKYLMNGN